jgi:hypothetical protein
MIKPEYKIEPIMGFLEELSQLTLKYGIGIAGYDGGLYMFDVKKGLGHDICNDGDIAYTHNNKYEVVK